MLLNQGLTTFKLEPYLPLTHEEFYTALPDTVGNLDLSTAEAQSHDTYSTEQSDLTVHPINHGSLAFTYV